MNSVVRAILSGMGGDAAREGSETAEHLGTLHLLARHCSFGPIVELGVGRGWSTLALLAGAREGRGDLRSYDIDAECKRRVAALAGEHAALADWTFKQLPSVQAAEDFALGTVGLLFIDTTHSYEETKEELDAWLPRMHPDGIICGTHHRPAEKGGVAAAVAEFVRDHGHWYNLTSFPSGRGFFILWPKVYIGRGFGEPMGSPW